jgi:hypothetical protein
VADDLDNKCQMLDDYCSDLRKRFESQKAWDARYPDFRTWDEAKWDFVNEVDPRSSTADVLTVERWLAVLEVAVAAFRQANRG